MFGSLRTRTGAALILAVACASAGVAAGQATPGTAGAPSAPPGLAAKSLPAQKILDNAIEGLRREYLAAQKNPKAHLREQCDWFDEHAVPDLSAEAVASALEKPIAGDARMVAYIRWQLLSGLPATLDPHDAKLVARLEEAYRHCPPLAPHFGLEKAEQAQLDALAARARREEDVEINSRVADAAKRVQESNKFNILYRDELYHRLPKTPETFLAAFQDADQRIKTAAGAETWIPGVVSNIYAWMNSDAATPADCAKLAAAVGELRFRAAWPYYDRVTLGKQNKLMWEKKSDTANPQDILPKLQQALTEASRKPRGAAPTP